MYMSRTRRCSNPTNSLTVIKRSGDGTTQRQAKNTLKRIANGSKIVTTSEKIP